MIRIRLLNNENSEILSAADLFKNYRELQMKWGDYIVPIPKIMQINSEKWVRFSSLIDVEVEGDFIPQNNLPKRQGLPSIPEPNWDTPTFVTRMIQWLEENWEPVEFDYFEISLSKYAPSVNVEWEQMEQVVPADARSEAYGLEIELNKIDLYAWSMRGAYYGILTFAQLARIQGKGIYLPIGRITDYPDFETRGLVDDISRGQRPILENFKKFIRFLSSIKQNVLVLWIEDMFAYSKYPEIGKGRAPLTKELIAELEDYALEHFIEIQPAVEVIIPAKLSSLNRSVG